MIDGNDADYLSYHSSVVSLVGKLNDLMNENATDNSVRVNALLTLLGMLSLHTSLTQDEFLAAVSWQLREIVTAYSARDKTLQ